MEDTYITAPNVNSDYQRLVNNITALWKQAKENAVAAVNTELLESNWQTGRYIVEFEQKGKSRIWQGVACYFGKGLDIEKWKRLQSD